MKSGGRRSVADEYGEVLSQPRETAVFWQPADNNELGTRNRVSEFSRFDPGRIQPVTKEPGAARLFFVKENAGRPVFSDERDPNIADHGNDLLR